MKVLSLKDHSIATIPENIGDLALLEELNLRDNLISELPASIIELKNLKKIDLKANELKRLPNGFENLKIEDLDISYNRPLDFAKESLILAGMNQLKKLDVSYNFADDLHIDKIRSALPSCELIKMELKSRRKY